MLVCFECGSTKRLEAHHVIPESLGGTKTVPLCAKCHGLIHDDDRLKISELHKESIKRRKEQGLALGRPKYGFDLSEGELIRNEEEQAVIAKMKAWREEGAGYLAIAKNLTTLTIPPKRGRAWHSKTVWNILQRIDGPHPYSMG